MNKVILKIKGMTCSACSSGLEKYLKKQTGVVDVVVNLVLAQATIEYENLTLKDLNKFISDAGFKSLGIYDPKEDIDKTSKEKNKLIIFGILALLLMYISMSHMVGLPVIPYLHMIDYSINYAVSLFILTILFLIYGRDILKSGYKNLVHKIPNMDTLVSIGVLASFLYSTYGMIMVLTGHNEWVENLYFESSSTVIFFIKLGRFIDKKNKEKTTSSIKELVTITPDKALLEDGNEVTIDEIKKGDILIAKPGMKIAVDGVITDGSTHLDEAFLTGESMPSKKSINDEVKAGSINIDGVIKYKADKIGRESTISEIVHLVIDASNTKAPIAKLADKVSSIFVPLIMIIAIITFICYLVLGNNFNDSINTFVTILVVACPCALGLATPLAIVVSVGMSAKNGILIKSSEILENAKNIDIICFDKTGTLTYGKLKISKIYNYSNYTDLELLTLVASLEKNSTHPISNAFSDYKAKKVNEFTNMPGIGLSGVIDNKKIYVGNNKLFDMLSIKNNYLEEEKEITFSGSSIIYVILDDNVIGLIGVKDIVRDNVKNVISKLNKLNKEVIMLTGDNKVTAELIAKDLGIKTVISEVLPKDKVSKINELAKNKKVMMVGDGISDAPSLASATIGVSIASGTDIAASSSDVILMHDNLLDIVNLINISNKTIKIIKQNLFWAFFYNICMIPIAIGIFKPFKITLTPMVASLAMMISSITVMVNALRLKKVKIEKD